MKTQLVRFVYAHRLLLKRLLPVRRPVLLKLACFKLYVRLDDWAVGARIALKRSYEAHVTRVLNPFLTPGAVVIDIGANIGYYTMLAAAKIGQHGKVIAFEPGSQNCELLRMSLQANGFANVAVYPYAVADSNKVVGFGMDDSNGRISQDDPARSAYQVQAVELDSFLRDEQRIDIIKMDIEGAEGRALSGMQQLIQRHRPLIFTEFSPHGLELASRMTPQTYLDRLRDLGYTLCSSPSTDQPPHIQNNEQIMASFTRSGHLDHIDLLAYPSERSHAVLAEMEIIT
jgi:FkbM family methyltransferase